MSETKRRLLDFEVFIRRPRVILGGASFEMRHPDEMTILGRAREAARVQRVQELLSIEVLTAGDLEELTREADVACREILIAPDEVHSSLRDGQRMVVLDRFGVLSWRRRRAARAPMTPQATSGRTFPASPGSTAATP